jgi:two-component system sensor histidine kinase KdpD
MTRGSSDAAHLAAGLSATAVVSLVLARWFPGVNAATAAAMLLLVVVVVAATSRQWVAVATSISAVLAFNIAFLPPVGTLTIADPQNWLALLAFLAVSLVASRLSALTRARTAEAMSRRDELARLFDLSRDVLGISDSGDALASLARSVARRFNLDYVAIAVPRGGEWAQYDAGAALSLPISEVASAFAAAQTTLEFDAYARTYAGHRAVDVGGTPVRLVPLRVGTRPIGVLAASGRPIEAGTLDTLAGVVAIAIERAHLLEERKAAELTRQSEQLKTALLASLGHDLRTPLTAIRVAASNLQDASLSSGERGEQSELIQAEVGRLTRLFENILEMARIDAGGLVTQRRPTHPSEVVAAARDLVGQMLRHHRVRVEIDPDIPASVDPRLTATALAHVLENAAHYTPKASAIDIHGATSGNEMRLSVRDRGPGIAPADGPRLFERFYRGDAARTRASGTGSGLWIARRLLDAEGGRVWAENHPEGGALFTIVVPAEPALASLLADQRR